MNVCVHCIHRTYERVPVELKVGNISAFQHCFSNSLIIHDLINQPDKHIWSCACVLKPGKGRVN